jgi:hypothetical protein
MIARNKPNDDLQTLERGNIYFFYRPRVEEHDPHGKQDVQRLYVVLSPDGKRRYRLAVIGRKQLPDPSQKGRGRLWGYVDAVADSPKKLAQSLQEQTYQTKTRGERHQPAARPAGEGVYRILKHGDHTHLVYVLELPEDLDRVQHELGIGEEASYVLSVKNPDQGGAPQAGLSADRQAEYPQRLQKVFRDRRFTEADPPDFLDYEGAEFLLIASADDVSEELGIQLEPEHESKAGADIFRDLRLEKSAHPLEPLFTGEWA